MSSRPNRPVNRPVLIALCLMLACVGVGVIGAASAPAAFYDVVFCAGGSGSGNPVPGARPGSFDWRADCGEPPSYPSDGDHYLRLNENTTGTAGQNDEVSLSWYAPPYTSIVAGGGYTRMPNAFNQGWRARFWGEDWGGGVHNVLLQGSGGIEGTGEFPWITKNTTSVFASHLWPYGGWDDYKRFVFGLACVRPGGCDRANFNAVDANTITLVVDDRQAPQVSFVDGATVRGEWVSGYQVLSWREFDQGSGLRFSRLGADGAVFPDGTIDHQAKGDCHISYVGGEFGKGFQPCFPGPWQRYYGLQTSTLSDGGHALSICLQDYGQSKWGTDTCDRRTIHTDNTAPGKPASLAVTSANPERYLDRFGATFSLPPDQGSPIAKVHYDVIDAAGKVVVPEKTLAGTNPTSTPTVVGPEKAGAYQLRVWLEDLVGHIGPAVTAPIPHDTNPPGAPQGLQVAAPDSPRSKDGFDLHWRNIVDTGSPVDAALYQVVNSAGGVVVPTRTVAGDNLQAIESIATPDGSGEFELRLWLRDAEGNVGAPTTAPLSYDCARSTVGGGQRLTAEIDGGDGKVVAQGQGATMRGELRGQAEISAAPLCIFEQVEGDSARDFLGIAVTDSSGDYRFAIGAGPSRTLRAVYRPGQRRVTAEARLRTQVKPTLRARRQVVRTGEVAHLDGEIPGPRNDDVVIVLQVRQGNGWLAFRRYRTRAGGHFEADYLFRRTARPTTYEMRAQVRETTGYPYLEGDSDPLFLRVLPKRASRKPCSAGRRQKQRGGRRCERGHGSVSRRHSNREPV